jgi:hypothetical protein
MIIIGVDFHPEFQQIAMVETETGELQERRLEYPNEAESFYRELASRSSMMRIRLRPPGATSSLINPFTLSPRRTTRVDPIIALPHE